MNKIYLLESKLFCLLFFLKLNLLDPCYNDCCIIEFSSLEVYSEILCSLRKRGAESVILASFDCFLCEKFGKFENCVFSLNERILNGSKNFIDKDIIKKPITANHNNIPILDIKTATNGKPWIIAIVLFHGKLEWKIEGMLLLCERVNDHGFAIKYSDNYEAAIYIF